MPKCSFNDIRYGNVSAAAAAAATTKGRFELHIALPSSAHVRNHLFYSACPTGRHRQLLLSQSHEMKLLLRSIHIDDGLMEAINV